MFLATQMERLAALVVAVLKERGQEVLETHRQLHHHKETLAAMGLLHQTIIPAVVAVEHLLLVAMREITLLEMVAMALHPQYLDHPSPMLVAVVVRLTPAQEVQQALAARAV